MCDQGGAYVRRIVPVYATCRRRRCFLLNGAWLSHSAYDARIVKIVVAIVLDSAEDDMPNHSVPNFYVVSVTELELELNFVVYYL